MYSYKFDNSYKLEISHIFEILHPHIATNFNKSDNSQFYNPQHFKINHVVETHDYIFG